MKVSVVVCTYSPDMYDHFVDATDSVLAQTYEDVELVIVVDGSETVYEQVDADFGDDEDVVLHLNDRNRGLLLSRNTGAELASGDVVAFMDDDAVADERWVEELVAAYEAHGAIAVGGKMTPEWVAGKPNFLPEEFYWLVGVTHEGFADGPGEVRNTFGSNISFRREVFLDLGGFDVAMGGRMGEKNLQGGETELCVRMKKEFGHGVWYTPNAQVTHKVFEYRTRFRWLLLRAFWQGYSKRAMETIVPGSSRDENEFLMRLITRSVPERMRTLVTRPGVEAVVQVIALAVFTGSVGSGYLYGVTRW